MKTANFIKLSIYVVASLTLLTAGCSKSKPRVTPIPGIARPSGAIGTEERLQPIRPTGGLEEGQPIPFGGETRLDRSLWTQDREKFKTETVYFDFDSSVIKPTERPKIETVAAFLKHNPQYDILIEGHCDERGTIEYNRALGERRALAIRAMLIDLGIAPQRIETISYGEERPVDPRHNEEAWAKNRRGEFVLLIPPGN